MHHTRQPIRRAFTLIELILSILIIALLMGLILVGVRQATRGARAAAETQDVSSMDMGIQNFKRDFGFLPLLVKDGYAGTPGQNESPLESIGSGPNARLAPNVYNLSDPDRWEEYLEFLQGQTIGDPETDPDYRFSVHSLAFYLMAALPESVDFVEGPGAHKPTPDGGFDVLTNTTYAALFDPKSGQVVQTTSLDEGGFELQDARGVAYRYYRWEALGEGDNGYNANDPIGNLRVPRILGSAAALQRDAAYSPAADDIELRGARYAIVAPGPDGVFGDIPIESLDDIEEALGRSFENTPEGLAEAQDAARADNIVVFGN